MLRSRRRAVATALIAFHLAALAAPAGPIGGTVASGAADITAAGGLTEIRQQTDRAIINWQGFSSQAGETVRFQQPSAASVTLNRVVSLDPSVLNGALQANGRLFLINPNGIVFGPTSQVNVGALVASTLSISDQDFQRGNYRLVQSDRPLASIINQGKITAAPGGLVALVAPVVNNEGEIVAAAGRVVLAGGAGARVDLDAGLVSLDVPSERPRDVVAGTDGAKNPLAEAVNNKALVEAGQVFERDGKIVLGGAEGLVVNTGRISTDGPSGGSVTIDSTQATVHGGRGVISANATAAGGAGGAVKVLGQRMTAFGRSARLEAKGGAGGAGGLVETSGAHVILQGQVDVSAPGGRDGLYLIDPQNLSIVDACGSLDGCLPDQTGVLEVCAGGTAIDTLSVERIKLIATSGDVEIQVGCSISFDNTSNIDMNDSSLTIRFVGACSCGIVTKSTAFGVGLITNADDVSIIADQTKAANFDLTCLQIRASGTVTLLADTFGQAPVISLGRIGIAGCTPESVVVRAIGGVITDGCLSGTSATNILADNVLLEAAQIGTCCAGSNVNLTVPGRMELIADTKMLVANTVVPTEIDVTLARVQPCQLDVRMGACAASHLRTTNDRCVTLSTLTPLDVSFTVTDACGGTVRTKLGDFDVGSGGVLTTDIVGETRIDGSVVAPGGTITLVGDVITSGGGLVSADVVSLEASDSIGFDAGSGILPLDVEAVTAANLDAGGLQLAASLRGDPSNVNVAVGAVTQVSVTAGPGQVVRDAAGLFFASGGSYALGLDARAGDLSLGFVLAGPGDLTLQAAGAILSTPGTFAQGNRAALIATGEVGVQNAPLVLEASSLFVDAGGDVRISDPTGVAIESIAALGDLELSAGADVDGSAGNGVAASTITVDAGGAILGSFDAEVVTLRAGGNLGTTTDRVSIGSGRFVTLAAGAAGELAVRLGDVPTSLDLTVAAGNPVSVQGNPTKFSGAILLATNSDGQLESRQVLAFDLTLRGLVDLEIEDIELSTGHRLSLFAPAGTIHIAPDASVVAERMLVSSEGGIFGNTDADPRRAIIATERLDLTMTGDGLVRLLNDGNLTVDAVNAVAGRVELEAVGDLFIGAGNLDAGNGTIRLAANECGARIVGGAGVVAGRRVDLEASREISAVTVNATERASFEIDATGGVTATLGTRPEEVRLVQEQAGSNLVSILFGGAPVLTAVVNGEITAQLPSGLTVETGSGDLRVGDIDVAGNDLTLDAGAGALIATPGTLLRADDVELTGSIVSAAIDARSLEVTVDSALAGAGAIIDVVSPVVDLVRADIDGFLDLDALGGINVRGNVRADGLVRLAAGGALFDTAPGGAIIRGARAELFGGLCVGLTTKPMRTDVAQLDVRGGAGGVEVINEGALRVQAVAGTALFLMARTGDLTVDAVTSGFTAELRADNGRIIDGNGAADNVTLLRPGGNLGLRAASGIGTLADPLEIVTEAVTAVTVTGDIALSELDHLQVAAAAGGDVAITSRGGYLILDTIVAGGRAAFTAAIGGLLDANGTALNVTARELIALLCDTAGTSADFLEVAVRNLDIQGFGAFVDSVGPLTIDRVQATGNVQVLASGDLALGRLESTLGKLDLAAAGNITDANGGAANIVSGSGGLSTLTATGTIGVGDALEVSLAPGFLSVLAGAAQGGVSVAIDGIIAPANSVLLVGAPGTVLFRGRVQGNGAQDEGAAERVNAGQVVAGANRAPQSLDAGNGQAQKENELIDTSGVE